MILSISPFTITEEEEEDAERIAGQDSQAPVLSPRAFSREPGRLVLDNAAVVAVVIETVDPRFCYVCVCVCVCVCVGR